MTDSAKRVRYFDHQFLREDDFRVDQAYHREQRRLHNRTLHTWGIAEGLELTFRQGADAITVGAGVAFDAEGRQIVIAEDLLQDVSAFGGQTAWVTIHYDEQETESSSEGGVTSNTRILEIPQVAVSPDPPEEPGTTLILGRVTVEVGDDGPVVGGLDDGEGSLRRRRVGISAGATIEVDSLVLSDPEIDASHWARLELEAPDQVRLDGGLQVSGDLKATDGLQITGDLTLGGALRVGAKPPIELKRFRVGASEEDLDTGYSDTEYAAVIAGFAALEGDIDSRKTVGSILQVYMLQKSERWWIRADIISERAPETWFVDVMFLRRGLVLQHGDWGDIRTDDV